jgi:N-acetylmuramoyl-L-alanine amidase
MKRILPLLIFLVALWFPQMVSAAGPDALSTVRIVLDQQEIVGDVPPIIQNDRTLVPIRVVSENLGATVGWDPVERIAYIRKGDLSLALKIDSRTIIKNDESFQIDAAPTIYNDRTLVPLRFVSEYIGLQVAWNGETRTVFLQSPPQPTPPVAGPVTEEPSIPTGSVSAIIALKDQIAIKTSMDKPEVSVFFLRSPNRAVIDIVYSKPEEMGEIIPVESLLIQGIRYSHFNNAPDTTRVVIDLNDRVDIKTEIQGGHVFLTLTPHIYKIVVDAGHGGKDPGAESVSGNWEKEFALDMAKRVAEQLRPRNRMQIIMTRNDDSYPTLDDRIKIANEANADLFLSIHANKFHKSTRGMETYYSRDDSQSLASTIHATVLPITGFIDRGVKQADFKVIKYTTMPAALLEVGFLSNPEEEAQLMNADFRQKVAEGIAQALVEYVGLP